MYRFANHFPRIGTILNDSQSDISFQNCINMPHVTCGQPRIIHELVRDPQDMDHKLSDYFRYDEKSGDQIRKGLRNC